MTPSELFSTVVYVDPALLAAAEMLIRAGRGYEEFQIAKKHGFRTITAPVESVRELQRGIVARLEAEIAPHDAAHGFVRGRSIVTGALKHALAVGMISVDLKDFFHSVTRSRVIAALSRWRGADAQISKWIGEMCTTKIGELKEPVLPQGAPSSPLLANLAAYKMDGALTALAESQGAVYTRYVDDLTFSARYELRRHALVDVLRCVHQAGFKANLKKVRIGAITPGAEQFRQNLDINSIRFNLTGGPRLSKKQLRSYRARIHNATCRASCDDRIHHEVEGISAFLSMVYGCIPRSIETEIERFRKKHGRK